MTKPGLSVPPGEPAINPGPRRMIAAALREVSAGGYEVTISIPGGEELAQRTFNPRLGIVGGVSILGTTGRVVPFSCPALREALDCALDIAQAAGEQAPVLVPGKIGKQRRASGTSRCGRGRSSRSATSGATCSRRRPAAASRRCCWSGTPASWRSWRWGTGTPTAARRRRRATTCSDLRAELLGGAPAPERDRRRACSRPAAGGPAGGRRAASRREVARSARRRLECGLVPAVVLIDMRGEILGSSGDLSRWKSA